MKIQESDCSQKYLYSKQNQIWRKFDDMIYVRFREYHDLYKNNDLKCKNIQTMYMFSTNFIKRTWNVLMKDLIMIYFQNLINWSCAILTWAQRVLRLGFRDPHLRYENGEVFSLEQNWSRLEYCIIQLIN